MGMSVCRLGTKSIFIMSQYGVVFLLLKLLSICGYENRASNCVAVFRVRLHSGCKFISIRNKIRSVWSRVLMVETFID